MMSTPCSDFEAEYVRAVQARTSPDKLNGRLPPYNAPGSVIGSRRGTDDPLMLKQGSSKQTALKNKRRASDVDPDEVSFKKKRRRIDDISQRLRGAEQNNNSICISGSAKTSVLNIQTNCSAKRSSKSAFNHDNEAQDLSGFEAEMPNQLDSVQNVKNLQLSQFYSSVIKDSVCDTSPFKGKMSAFEISLLKGKQSMERRKSLEAAALRSSPRMNSNLPKPDYKDNKRRQRTNSVPQTGVEKLRARKRTSAQRKVLRIRTHRSCKDNKALSAVSPSSIENRCIEQNSPARKRRKRASNIESIPEVKIDPPPSSPNVSDRTRTGTSSAVNEGLSYRMNGSPKLKGTPTVLSLNNLSGIPQKFQGSSFSSFHADLRANGVSGTPPALPEQIAALASETDDRVPSSARPDTLSFNYEAITHSQQQGTSDTSSTSSTGTKAPRPIAARQNSVSKTKTKRMSLEETVNMLRQSAADSCSTNDNVHPTCMSPSSDGKLSRRSSRSTTPNISPIKSEVLTPSNTPCSTPVKSPRTSPFRLGGKLQQSGRRRRFLFAKNDDVLARWHDGLFYSGKILRIDEKNSKCLLRYEDNSEYWSMSKDIHRVAREEEMICCVCFGENSEPPDEIVLCDNCSQGYHQKCHSPHITSRQIVDPDDEWFCRECVFLMYSMDGAVKDGKAGEELKKMKHSLPYELDVLTWDNQHKNNIEQCYCYCGGPGIWYQKMLQCCRCKQWFHEACIQCLEYPLMFGDSFYIFVCTMCNLGKEYVKRLDVEWQDLMHIALFNLVMMNKRKKYFHIDNDIIPWINANWKALQVQKYEKVGREEKLRMTLESLQNNKSRFSSGNEMQKPCMLWGLRIRVPPPRIFITLPVTTEVSDDVMKKLKIKGRRSKVFIPMECKSPVMQIRHSPLRPNTFIRKRLDNALTMKVEGTNSPSKSQGPPKSPLRKSRVKLPLLDRLIPRQTSFSGCNHPFKTDIEIEDERNEMNKLKDIWASYQTMSSNIIDSVDLEEFGSEGPPILEKVEPISPSTSNSSTPPMPDINKKNRSKKSVQVEKDQSETGSIGRRSSRRVSLKANAPPNIIETQAVKTEISVKKVKTSCGNYFCAFDRTGYGKGFYIMGKRAGGSAYMEYLVDWDV